MATGPGTSTVEIEFTAGTWTDVTGYVAGANEGSIQWRATIT